VLVSGTLVSLWPELSFREAGAWSYLRASAGVATSLMLTVWLCVLPTNAYAAPRPRAEITLSHATRPLPTGAFGATAAGLGLGALVALRRRRFR
jgi:hypothetical protein